jgi:hypothetical protein
MISKVAATAVRLLAIFASLYVASCATIWWTLPRLVAWHNMNCTGHTSTPCHASAVFLSYWWLALLPALAVATALLNSAFAGRR